MATKKKAKAKKTKKKAANPVGRPPKYQTADELQAKVQDYFDHGVNEREYVVGGKLVKIPVPTITGLVLYLGFCDRQSFYDLEKQEKFSCTVKAARSAIEQKYEENLTSSSPVGSIFALKNFGWIDKQEVGLDQETAKFIFNIGKGK